MLIKILHLSTALSWRGGEQQIAYLMDGLEKNKAFQQWVLCAKGGKMAQYCQENNFNYLPVKKHFSLDPLFAWQLKNYCQKLQITILHVHDAHAHNIAILAADVWGNQTPIIVARRVDFPPKNSLFTRYKYNHPKIVSIICVSNTIKHLMMPCVQKKEQLQTIYSGIDQHKFEQSQNTEKLRTEFHIPATTPIVGVVAALAPHKDLNTFVRTAKVLMEQKINAHFMIIGEGKERTKITTLIQQLNLEKHITLTGFRNDIAHILPELYLFLMTSSSEGLGTSILDAFAAKVPVVATNAGGIAEMVIHEKTGLLAPIKDSECLARHVKQLLKEESLRKSLVDNASKRVKAFSKEQMAVQTMAVYQTIEQKNSILK